MYICTFNAFLICVRFYDRVSRRAARYSPDTAVKNTMALTVCAKAVTPFSSLTLRYVAATGKGRSTLSAPAMRPAYRMKASDKCAARRYCDTRGTSEGPWNRSSRPDFTMYHPMRPCNFALCRSYPIPTRYRFKVFSFKLTINNKSNPFKFFKSFLFITLNYSKKTNKNVSYKYIQL